MAFYTPNNHGVNAAINTTTSTSGQDHAPADQFLFLLYLLLLAIAPWPLGSNRDWAWPISIFLACGIALVLIYRDRDRLSREATLLLTGMGLLAGWIGIQLISGISFDFYSTRSDLIKTIGYTAFAFSTICLLRNPRRFEVVIYVVVVTGLLQALVGTFQLLVLDNPPARGSFINRNHYAGYLEMVLGLGIGLLIARMADKPEEETWLSNILGLITGPQARLRLILIVVVVGLVLSRSRGGNMSFFIAVLLTSGAAMVITRQFSRKTMVLIASILIIDAFLVGSYFGVDRVAERVQNTTLATESRDEVSAYTLNMLKDHFLVGTGSGTYEIAFPAYRGDDISRRVTHAENDYLEFMVELGLPGIACLLLILFAGLRGQTLLLKRSQYLKGIGFGCMLGTCSLLLHSAVDFNLQIPSNTILFVLLLSMPLAALSLPGDN